MKAEIATILYKDQIRFIKSENQWPEGFENQDIENDLDKLTVSDPQEISGEDDSDQDDSDLFQNTNRPNYQISESEDSDSETEESESDRD